MSEVLTVRGLCKTYPAFRLEDVSFSVAPGSITGFIGRNGAGKTTTLKSLLNLVHPDAGELRFFGLDPAEREYEIRQRVGYAGGTNLYYPKKKLGEIAAVTAGFYRSWDAAAWRDCLTRFALDPDKRLEALSEGMKVKFNLALALSHRAELLILDEPTSGLDPVSRDELLELFLDLAREGVSLLFSTHIISDLEKCADSIVYIQNGKILFSGALDAFAESYLLYEGPVTDSQRAAARGVCRSRKGESLLLRRADAGLFPAGGLRAPGLEEIMTHLEREGDEK
ncbi:MAG: ABC transporter ATP-binding protein [Oscillospiraceae bacterium]|nr:ABC transporter ATP-binding protein [Oscillospiraceae bacterium]